MPDCAKEKRLDVGIWCKTMPGCAKERRLDVESTDVLDITLLSNSSAPQFCKFEWNDDKLCHIALQFHFHSLNLVQSHAGLCQRKKT